MFSGGETFSYMTSYMKRGLLFTLTEKKNLVPFSNDTYKIHQVPYYKNLNLAPNLKQAMIVLFYDP